MSIGHSLNSDNDIFLGANGSLSTVEDGAQVVQHVQTRLQFFTGEWFLDLFAGTPYYDEILTKPADLSKVEAILRTRILQTDGVLELTYFAMDFDVTLRYLTVDFSAETTYGSIDSTKVTING